MAGGFELLKARSISQSQHASSNPLSVFPRAFVLHPVGPHHDAVSVLAIILEPPSEPEAGAR